MASASQAGLLQHHRGWGEQPPPTGPLGSREEGAGLWRAAFVPLPYALSFLHYSREGVGGSSGSNRRRLVKGSCQNLPPPHSPPSSFSSFQFNDQTSAWKKGEGAGGTESSPRRCCCVCMSERVQADTPPFRPVPPLPSDRASTPGRGREERGGGGSRCECQCSARLLSRTHCGEVGEGGRCVPFSPVPFLTLTGRGQSPAEGNKGKGGGKPTPAAPESPRGRQSPAGPADSSAGADRAPGSAAVFLLSSSTFSSCSSSPSLKGESSVRRRERNLGRCVGCPAIGSVLAIKMKSKKGSCDGVPGQSGVPRAPTRGGKGKGGLSLSQPESLCLLGLLSPVPPATPPGLYPVEDCSGCSARRQNMRGCCLEAAASLRRWLPVKNMSSRSPRVLRQLLFSPPPSSLFLLPSRKTLFYAFPHRATPSPRGGRGCGCFSQLGARKAGPSGKLFVRGDGSVGGHRREGFRPLRALDRLVLLKVGPFSTHFNP